MSVKDESFDSGIRNQLLLRGRISSGYFIKLVLRVGDEVFDLIGRGGQVLLRSLGDSHDEQYPQEDQRNIYPVSI